MENYKNKNIIYNYIHLTFANLCIFNNVQKSVSLHIMKDEIVVRKK